MPIPPADITSVTFRASETIHCRAFSKNDTLTLRGREAIYPQTTACCAYMLANIRPLLEALEEGIDPEELGLNLDSGIFHCQDIDCEARFTVLRHLSAIDPVEDEDDGYLGDDATAEMTDNTQPTSEPLADTKAVDTEPPQEEPSDTTEADLERARNTASLAEINPGERPFLKRFEVTLARHLVHGSPFRQFQPSELILQPGKPTNALYIIQEGKVHILGSDSDGNTRELAILPAGECFGEMSILLTEPFNYTVRAATGCSVWRIQGEQLDGAMQQNLQLHRQFSQIFSQRLKQARIYLPLLLRQGVTGMLAMLGLPELVQTLFASESTGTLYLALPDRTKGCLQFVKGQVHFALCDEIQGFDAFRQMLTWRQGRFCFEEGTSDLPRNMSGNILNILMEELRKIDNAPPS